MHQITIQEAAAHFPAILNDVMGGEEFIVMDKEKSIAKLTPLNGAKRGRTRVGFAKGLIVIHDDFDEPLAEFKDYM